MDANSLTAVLDQVMAAAAWAAAHKAELYVLLTSAIGTASLLAALLAPLARRTAWKGDDMAVSALGRLIDALHALASRLGCNPSQATARPAAAAGALAALRRLVLPIMIAAVATAVGCAGVAQQQPQAQRAGDAYGAQTPNITYNVNVDHTDSSSAVTVNIGTAAQDASQQGSAEQAQTAATGAVDNKPTISPTVSPTISAPLP